MKICILSMQRVNNMGSLLQSYALKKTLEFMGADVEFMDIKKIEQDFVLLGNYKQSFTGENELSGVRGKLSKLDKYTINRIRIRIKCDRQDSEFENFRKNFLHVEKKSDRYDLGIIGSDEVFNCLNSGAWGFTSQLFGNIPEANKVITYAASCGSTKYSELPEAVAERIRDSFKNISGFSVRDKNTFEFVSDLTDKPVGFNLDPVLIYDFSHEVEKASMPKVPEHYCVIYSYYNRIHTKEEIDAINEFCDKHKMTPIAVGAPQFWIKNYIVCSPFQCLKIFANSDFVITDTFHGTIFATKYAKKFAVMTRASNLNKLQDLVERIGVDKHLMKNLRDLDTIYSHDKDGEVENLLLKEREITETYLRNSLYERKQI